MSDLTDRLDQIQARADAATEGPWRASILHGVTYEDGSSSHVAGIYPGSTSGPPPVFVTNSIDRRDAEFIAASRTDVPALLAEVRRLQAGAEQFAVTLGFGYPEPAATLAELVEPVEQAFSEARDHFECPVICELCGEKLASQTCEKCHGSGCLPNAELAHLECDECAGVGKVHPGCTERSYADLAAEARRLQAAVKRVRELHVPFRIYDECECEDRSTPGHVDIEEVGITCNLLYVACRECCTSGVDMRYQTEDCADGHDHRDAYCPTIAALDGDEP